MASGKSSLLCVRLPHQSKRGAEPGVGRGERGELKSDGEEWMGRGYGMTKEMGVKCMGRGVRKQLGWAAWGEEYKVRGCAGMG